uniref:Large ribosomal subunit protein bL21c n=1 Tax=Chondria sp. (in: red algae) TaxID=1982705 RepID=A0A1Z1ME61_9FLOR|nr:ribosomal protein L21 [Chondria sp. (in: red algae)]
MVYAVVEMGSRQIIIEPGKFYDVQYMHLNPGDIICLNRILLLKDNKTVNVGSPCLPDVVIKAKVLRHIKGKKLTVFKFKPKKNSRLKKGHRQNYTRILIEEIKI